MISDLSYTYTRIHIVTSLENILLRWGRHYSVNMSNKDKKSALLKCGREFCFFFFYLFAKTEYT